MEDTETPRKMKPSFFYVAHQVFDLSPQRNQVFLDHQQGLISLFSYPFSFEGHKRSVQALEVVDKLQKNVDRLPDIADEQTPPQDAFLLDDDVLRQGVESISDITGLVTVDFADVKAVMKDSGTAMLGVGV